MHIGLTGSRNGITNTQGMVLLYQILSAVENKDVDPEEESPPQEIIIHHGMCKGVDKDAHDLLRKAFPDMKIHGHPCTLLSSQADCDVDVKYEVKPPLDRNKDIVAATEVLFVCPNGYRERLRSGTWATYRYGKEAGKKVTIIYPDGTLG